MTKRNKLFILFVLFFFFLIIINFKNREGYNNIYPSVNAWDVNTNVNLPLTTTQSCKNKCGPVGRCTFTNEQCVKDVDCYGCGHFPLYGTKPTNIKGTRYSGKSLPGTNILYSDLTTSFGSDSAPIDDGMEEPVQYYKGYNNWQNKFDEGMKIYKKQYYTGENNYVDYKERDTLSGDFVTTMPYSANNDKLKHRGLYI